MSWITKMLSMPGGIFFLMAIGTLIPIAIGLVRLLIIQRRKNDTVYVKNYRDAYSELRLICYAFSVMLYCLAAGFSLLSSSIILAIILDLIFLPAGIVFWIIAKRLNNYIGKNKNKNPAR